MLKIFPKVFLYFFIFIVVGAIAALLFYKIADFKKTVEAPSLIGKNIAEAAKLLNDMGIFLEIEGEEYNPQIDSGHITRQDIKEGEKIKKATFINVFVSREEAAFLIPYLEGMDMKDVELTLERSGIEVGKITRVHSDSVEKNRVIAQRPLPGYSQENRVHLLVSLSAYDVSYRCPSFVNMTIYEAKKIAGALGINLVEQKGKGSIVIFQKPEAGAIVKKGDFIEVKLGRGWGLWF